ncbi:unnamed protein product [Durusdinium trenchii]|uniref:Uncharacterized protein n=2 Tax=Durusdinium trenchii TaxID=1381693 RepID=A0ABP0ILI5_9DINO
MSPTLRNDFYHIFACDPGRSARESEEGGALTAALLQLLPYKLPISEIFKAAAKSVSCQRPWVDMRPGTREPILGDLPSDLPVLLGSTDRLGSSDTLAKEDNDETSNCSSDVEFVPSDFEILRFYWLPIMSLVAFFIHALLLFLWILGVVHKQYATRLAMPPALSFLALAMTCQNGQAQHSTNARCGSTFMTRLRGVWWAMAKYAFGGWGASCFCVLGFGEVVKEQDWVAAAVSWVLAIAAASVNNHGFAVIANLCDRSSDQTRRRTVFLWGLVCSLSLVLAHSGHFALMSGEEALHQIEFRFHFFMLVFLAAWYLCVVHDSDPSLSACGSQSSHAVSTYMMVPFLAISIPFIQSISFVDAKWSSSWQLWLLVEYVALYLIAVVCDKFRPEGVEATLVADA